jgi:micrococcal nuclease
VRVKVSLHKPLARVLALAVGIAAAWACDGGERCGPSSGVVARTIDGDTVELESGERVRYLMIDTPESTNGKDDCFGTEAAQFNRDAVEGREIDLEYDEVCEDDYDRLLAYVSIEGREINALMVERGYACVLQIPPNGEARADEFDDLEYAAKQNMIGLWGACEEVTCD